MSCLVSSRERPIYTVRIYLDIKALAPLLSSTSLAKEDTGKRMRISEPHAREAH